MSSTLLTLPEDSIQTLSERQLRDLVEYTNPAWVLVQDDVSPRQRQWLSRRIECSLLHVTDSGWHVENDQPFLMLNDPDDIPEKTGNEKNLCVVSSFIEEDVDPHSFSVSWNGLDAYRSFADTLGEQVYHLAVNHPADRTIEPEDTPLCIHGVGNPPDRTRFPSLGIGPSVYLEENLSHSNLGLQAIKGIGRSRAHLLRKNGFETRRSLASQSPEDLLALDSFGPYYACVSVVGARAHETDTPLWFGEDPLRDQDRVYVDIETDSTRVSNIWLIGVYDESEDNYHSFIQTEDPDDARTVPAQFAKWVHDNAAEKTFVAWFGKQFDFRWLDHFIQEHAPDRHAETWQRTKRTDLLLDVVRPRVSLPVRSHKLDVVARRLGYDRAHEGIDGSDAAAAYRRWREGEEPDWDRWIAYCRDDVMGMKYLYDQLREAPRELHIDSVRDHYRRAGTVS